ncbi:MAG TPA: PEP/pyruvate-binding domain-containing protein, partial [Anaerolineales bacterium]
MDTISITQTSMILPIDSPDASLDLAGGKGANLARLKRAGFLVPDGFLITTPAYQAYVSDNDLDPQIDALLSGLDPADPNKLEAASARIRSLFDHAKLPSSLANEITAAYAALGQGALAVRSSATTEDLPEMSFAGQQDTYLNVLGVDSLLRAVANCWSSLWTARAIAYRLRSRIAGLKPALAVVVQRMVESQASGVLFTANPLTGLRTEMVIDATFGLGEALVSGQVEPDHYVVDTINHKITAMTLGSKARSVRSRPGGGTAVIAETAQDKQALPDGQILQLAGLGKQVASLYEFPQDIEWAWAQDTLYLLQSRPITSLFPLPEGMPVEPLKVFFSMAAVQGMLDPLTPIGRDALQEFFAAGIRLFGIPATRKTQTVLYTAGERLWVNFTAILKNSVGRSAIPVVLSLVEPSIGQAVLQIKDDPRLQPGKAGISWGARLKMTRFFLPLAASALLNFASPEARRKYIINRGEGILKEIDARFAAIQGDRYQKLEAQIDVLPGMAKKHLPRMFVLFVSAVAAGMASWNILNRLAAKVIKTQSTQVPGQPDELILQVTRGMPYNPTTEMDL